MKIRKTREDKEADIISDFIKELDLSDDRVRKRLLIESSKQELFRTSIGEEFLSRLSKGDIGREEPITKEKQPWWRKIKKRSLLGRGLFLVTVGLITAVIYKGEMNQSLASENTIYSQHNLLQYQAISGGESNSLQNEELEQEDNSRDYVISDSNLVYLNWDEIQNLTYEQMEIAMYEISARHGRKFFNSNLQAYFEAKNWYQPMSTNETYSDQLLNEIERSNVILIKECMDWYEIENNVVAFDYSSLTIDDMRECLKTITFSEDNWEKTEESTIRAMYYDLLAAGLIVNGELRIRQIGAL